MHVQWEYSWIGYIWTRREKFEGLVIEEPHEEINAFVEIFNNAYEAWKWIQQYDKAIEEIKLSLLKLLKKSNYLPMRIEKN